MSIAPSGRITIVETKLWRNPEATRQVIAQILDYATRVSTWSYEELEKRCRKAMAPAPLAAQSLYGLISSHWPDETPAEQSFVDAVEKALREARFLLLVVGDGIRTGLEGLMGALHAHPQMLFTFGLVELQVFQHPALPGGRLVVPQVVANSTEVVRAVVRVETTGKAEVRVEMEAPDQPSFQRRRSLSEEEFFESVGDVQTTDVIKQIVAAAQNLGAFAQYRGSSVSVRMMDPRGSKQKLTLFVVTTSRTLYTGWLPAQLEKVGMNDGIAFEWIAALANLVPGVAPDPKNPGTLSREIRVGEIGERLDQFIELLSDTVDQIRDASAE